MKKLFHIIFCFSLFFVLLTNAGHIYSNDPVLKYQNSGEVEMMTLFFAVETALPANNYIEFHIPMDIQGSSAKIGLASATTLTAASAPSSSFVSPNTQISIKSATGFQAYPTWYKVEITIPGNKRTTAIQTVGVKAPIKAYTSNEPRSRANRVWFDMNEVFCVFAISAAPGTNFDLTISPINDSNAANTDLAGTRNFQVDINPLVNISSGAIFDFMLDNSAFKLSGSCTNDKFDCLPTDTACTPIVALSPAPTCTITSGAAKLEIASNLKDSQFRTKFTVSNPAYKPASTSTGIIITFRSRVAPVIFQRKTGASISAVAGLSITNAHTLYLHGVKAGIAETTGTSVLTVGIFKSGAGYTVYNNIRQFWKVSKNLPSAATYKVLTDLGTVANVAPVASSFYHNIPNTGTTSQAGAIVTITKVSPLAAATEYFVGAKYAIGNGLAGDVTGILKVKIQSAPTGGSYTDLTSYSTGLTKTPIVNKEYQGTNWKVLIPTGVVSIATSANAAAVKTALMLGAATFTGFMSTVENSASQDIAILLTAAAADVCGATAADCESGATALTAAGSGSLMNLLVPHVTLGITATVAKGIRVAGNLFGTTTADENCVKNDLFGGANEFACVDYGVAQDGQLINEFFVGTKSGIEGNQPYAILQFTCTVEKKAVTTLAACGTVTDSSAGTTVEKAAYFTIPGVSFASSYGGTSQYPDDTSLDLQVGFGKIANAAALTTATLLSQGIINVYTVTGLMENNKVAMVNYYKKSAAKLAVSDKITSFMRISGSIGTAGASLGLFTDSLTTLASNIKCAGAASCSVTDSAITTANMYQVHSLLMIESAITASTDFNFYIPIDPAIAIVSANLVPFTKDASTGVYQMKAVYRAYGDYWKVGAARNIQLYDTTMTAIADATNAFQTANFKIGADITNAAAVALGIAALNVQPLTDIASAQSIAAGGVTATAALFYNDALPGTAGAASKQGAHFTVSEGEGMFAGATLTWSYTQSTCLTFTYNPTHNLIICPADAGAVAVSASPTLGVDKVIISDQWGVGFTPSLFYAWSSAQNLLVYVNNNAAPTITAHTCTHTALTAFPKNAKMTKVSFSVTPTKAYTGTVTVKTTTTPGDALPFTVTSACSTGSGGCNADLTNQATGIVIYTVSGGFSSATSITFFADSPDVAAVAKTFVAEVRVSGRKVEDCATAQDYKGSDVADTAALTVSASKYMAVKSTIGSFEISLKSTIFYSGTNLDINLGWLVKDGGNGFRCIPYEGTTPSMKVRSIDSTSLTAVVVDLKSDVSGSINIKCVGAELTDGVSTTALSAAYKSGATTVLPLAPAVAEVAAVTFADAVALTVSTLVKNVTAYPGLESNYLLNVKPTASYKKKDVLRVVFKNNGIPPRLNQHGRITCLQEGKEAICDTPDERVFDIKLRAPLDNSTAQPGGHNFTIVGVAQPESVSITNDKVYTAILENGVAKAHHLQVETAISTATIEALPVSSFTVTGNAIGSTTSFEFVLKIPAGKVVAGQAVYIDLPPFFDGALKLNFAPTVTMMRVGDTTDFVDTTHAVAFSRRIKIVLKVDAANSAASQMYTLKVSGLKSPIQSTTGKIQPVVWFFETNLYRTVSTLVQSASPPDFTAGSSIPLKWMQSRMNVYLGYFKGFNTLMANGDFKLDLTLAASGSAANLFIIHPPQLKISTGTPGLTVMLAGVAAGIQGVYFLQFTKTGDANKVYTPVPPIKINLLDEPCQITALPPFDIYIGGISLPIVFQLTCTPAVDLTLTGNITNSSNTSLGFADVTFLTGSGAVSYTYDSANPQPARFQFLVKHSNAQATPLANAVKMFWVLSGSNMANFMAPSSTQLNLITPVSTVDPVAPTLTVTSVAGEAQIGITCDQTGIAYFAAGLLNADASSAVDSITAADIKAKTLSASVAMTKPAQSDPNYIVHGYTIVGAASTEVKVTLRPVRALGNYSVIAYCSNQLEKNSPAGKQKWNQTGNGGKFGLLALTSEVKPTAAHIDALACSLAQIAVVKKKSIANIGGKSCPPARRLRILQNTTNTSNTTNTTTKVTYMSYIIILTDPMVAVDNTFATVDAAVKGANFLKDLEKASSVTAGKLNLTKANLTSLTTALLSVVPNIPGSLTVSTQKTSVSFTLRVTNTMSVCYVGVGKSSDTTPTFNQLVAKESGSNTTLVGLMHQLHKMNVDVSYEFTGLSEGTDYKVFFGCRNLEPGKNRVASTVNVHSFRTASTFGSAIYASLLSILSFALILIVLI